MNLRIKPIPHPTTVLDASCACRTGTRLSYPATGAMLAFDREPHRTLRNEQKQFPELSDDGKRGYKAQDGECQTARQFLNKRNTWPDRANAKF